MTIRFSGVLLRLVDYQRAIDVPAATLGDALARLEARYPPLRQVLRDADGRLRPTHRIFINGRSHASADLTTPLSDSDEVEFLTAIAGG